MKTLTDSLKLGLRPDEGAQAVGSKQLFTEMVAAGWIAPVVQRHKLTIYDRGDVAKAWARILAGEQPPSLKRAKVA
ncbi:MAG: hypothetical protein ABMA13_01170 [Chthoniobacteraceae bacterium]